MLQFKEFIASKMHMGKEIRIKLFFNSVLLFVLFYGCRVYGYCGVYVFSVSHVGQTSGIFVLACSVMSAVYLYVGAYEGTYSITGCEKFSKSLSAKQ